MKKQDIYLYDGTFIGLLNLIKKLVVGKVLPYNIKTVNYQPTLFEELISLEIKNDESTLREIFNKVGKKAFQTAYYVFLSSEPNKEIIIFYFLVHSFKYQDKIFIMRNIKSVAKALKIAKYVSHENHKFKGFLRFKELENNILYAQMAPENNIIHLLSEHFQKRLQREYWIIKDTKRNIISMYDKKKFYIIEDPNFNFFPNKMSENEQNIESLWKSFYQTIAIKERQNERCRINFMPKKYWQYITEVSDEYEKSNNK